MNRIYGSMARAAGLSVCVAMAACTLVFSQADAQQGSCDPGAGQRKVLEVNSEKTIESGDTITVTKACDNVAQTIKKCAVLAHKKIKAQKWCYPDGKPAYFEYFDILEFNSD